MRSDLRKKWDDLHLLVEKKYRAHKYRSMARQRVKAIDGGYDCRLEYQSKVVPYWKKFGQKPEIIWWKLLAEHTRVVDPRYIPDDMWLEHILPYYSNVSFRRFGEDKCLHGVWFHDVKRPYTVAANVAGVYYDDEYNIIDEGAAIERCLEYKRFLMKPSIDSGEGRLIRFFDDKCIDAEQIRTAFYEFGNNFIAQEIVRQHQELSAFNETSLNTIRIVSFLFEGEVHVLSSILRIGGNGSRLDNVGAGGFACAITPEGTLAKFAVNRQSQWSETNQNGLRFEGAKIPSYQEAVTLVKRIHCRLAHFKIIGWDIGIDREGDPVLIEFNTNPGQNQYSCGPTFGDLTDKVLEDVFITRTLEKSNN